MAIIAPDIAIDLGTSNTQVYVKNKGIVLNEPTLMVVQDGKKKTVKAFGDDARLMLGRTMGDVTAVRPLKDGVIRDYDMAEYMLEFFIRKSIGSSRLVRPRGWITIPSSVTAVERKVVREAAESAGIRRGALHLIAKPFAAALGSGLPVFEPKGSMVVDIGGGTSEVAVLSLGDIVAACSVRVAGDKFDEAILSFIKKKYNLLVGERTAEDIKIKIGSAYPYENEQSIVIKGRNLVDGLPKDVTITAAEVREALADPLDSIVEAIKTTLEKTPPELSADIIDHGIMLTGGGALLRGIDMLIMQQTGMPVHIAARPLDCVVDGAGKRLGKVYASKYKHNRS